MPYQVTLPGLSSARGTHYTPGSDFLYFLRSSNDAAAGIYRVPIRQAVVLSESYGQTAAPSLKTFNLNNATGVDLQWVTNPNRLRGQLSSKIMAIPGATSLDAITPEQLVALNWSSIPSGNNSIPEAGTSTTGNFYAVQIPLATQGQFNYAKVRVYNDGVTRLDWVSYLVSPNPIRISTLQGEWNDIAVTEYENTIFVSGVDSSGEHRIMQLERTTSGSYPLYDAGGAVPLNSRSLSNPRQMVLDGGFVYVVDDTSVWRIEGGGDQVELVNGLQGGVGLLLRSSGASLTAYISDTAGDIRVVNLSEFNEQTQAPLAAPEPSFSIGGQSGFMSWASAERTAIFVADQTAGRIVRLALDDGMMTDEITGLTEPWSVEVVSNIELYVCSAGELGRFDKIITVNDVLLLGIGLVPFDYINSSNDDDLIGHVLLRTSVGPNDGRANTSVSPGYYFSQYPNIPFGGSLSLQVNHEAAWDAGFRYFRVTLYNVSGTSRTINGAYVNMLWTGNRFDPITTTPTNNRYPIRDPDELWYNHFLGAVIPTTTADNGHNVLRVEFFTSSDASEISSSVHQRLLLIDNTRYNTTLQFPRLGEGLAAPTPGVFPPMDCGCIGYDTGVGGAGKNTQIAVDFAAWQPQAVGQYSLRFYRGGVHLPALAQDGDVTPAATTRVKDTVGVDPLRIGHLLGSCDIANILINLTVSSRVIDGFGFVNLGSHSQRTFTLAPESAVVNTPWP
jgi:hypothetical protein